MTSLLMSLLNPAPYVPPPEEEGERSRHVNYGKAVPLVRAALEKFKESGTNKLAAESGVSVRRVRYAMAILVAEGFAVAMDEGCNSGNFRQAVWRVAENASDTAPPVV